jgi:hypothetical protein
MDRLVVYFPHKKLLQNFIRGGGGGGYNKYFQVNFILVLISKSLHYIMFQSDFNKFLHYDPL